VQSAGGETDTLLDVNPTYTWGNDEENIFGDFEVTLEAVETYTGPYDLPVECIDTAVRTITIINDWLQFPNAVTPNGDGINDYWRVVNLLECGVYSMNELWIYNAWGVLVYHAENIDEESDFWYPDKTHSPDGTYYFRFSAKSHWGVVRTNGMIEVISE
jgi:gliding motility-associated-like protein